MRRWTCWWWAAVLRGLAAAITAKRAGAEVLILERYGCFGGVISQVGVEGFAWYRHEAPSKRAAWCRSLRKCPSGWAGKTQECQSTSQALDAEMFKYAADRMVEEAGIRPILHCTAVEAILEGDRITGVITESKSAGWRSWPNGSLTVRRRGYCALAAHLSPKPPKMS